MLIRNFLGSSSFRINSQRWRSFTNSTSVVLNTRKFSISLEIKEKNSLTSDDIRSLNELTQITDKIEFEKSLNEFWKKKRTEEMGKSVVKSVPPIKPSIPSVVSDLFRSSHEPAHKLFIPNFLKHLNIFNPHYELLSYMDLTEGYLQQKDLNAAFWCFQELVKLNKPFVTQSIAESFVIHACVNLKVEMLNEFLSYVQLTPRMVHLMIEPLILSGNVESLAYHFRKLVLPFINADEKNDLIFPSELPDILTCIYPAHLRRLLNKAPPTDHELEGYRSLYETAQELLDSFPQLASIDFITQLNDLNHYKELTKDIREEYELYVTSCYEHGELLTVEEPSELFPFVSDDLHLSPKKLKIDDLSAQIVKFQPILYDFDLFPHSYVAEKHFMEAYTAEIDSDEEEYDEDDLDDDDIPLTPPITTVAEEIKNKKAESEKETHKENKDESRKKDKSKKSKKPKAPITLKELAKRVLDEPKNGLFFTQHLLTAEMEKFFKKRGIDEIEVGNGEDHQIADPGNLDQEVLEAAQDTDVAEEVEDSEDDEEDDDDEDDSDEDDEEEDEDSEDDESDKIQVNEEQEDSLPRIEIEPLDDYDENHDDDDDDDESTIEEKERRAELFRKSLPDLVSNLSQALDEMLESRNSGTSVFEDIPLSDRRTVEELPDFSTALSNFPPRDFQLKYRSDLFSQTGTVDDFDADIYLEHRYKAGRDELRKKAFQDFQKRLKLSSQKSSSSSSLGLSSSSSLPSFDPSDGDNKGVTVSTKVEETTKDV